jgi:hypothetical protein
MASGDHGRCADLRHRRPAVVRLNFSGTAGRQPAGIQLTTEPTRFHFVRAQAPLLSSRSPTLSFFLLFAFVLGGKQKDFYMFAVRTHNQHAPAKTVNLMTIEHTLELAKGITDILLRTLLNNQLSPRADRIIRESALPEAVASLVPLHRTDAGASFPLKPNLGILRRALACQNSWEELSRSAEYDERWGHSIRVQSSVKIDATDALGRGRQAQIRLLFLVDDNAPQLKSCAITYEEASTSDSPISLLCAQAVKVCGAIELS